MNRPGLPYSELWVCFAPPPAEPPPHALILSFMSPGDEWAAAERLGERFVSARDVVRQVHAEARRVYIDLIARVGATPCVKGKSLRQMLTARDGYSRWWFHKVSFKDCVGEADPTYLTLIRLMCLQYVFEKHAIGRVRYYGASAEFRAAATGSSPGLFRVGISILKAFAYGITSRLLFISYYLRLWWYLRGRTYSTSRELDVALEGHWDWSLRPDVDGRLDDRYFRDLPEKLEAEQLRVGWLTWCEPCLEPWQRGRPLRQVVASALDYPQVDLIERYLGFGDILLAGLRVGHLLTFLRYSVSSRFRDIFRVNKFDLYPVMRSLLVEGFTGSDICRREALLVGIMRATRRLRPKVLLTFLELFPHSRAMYAGIRLGSRDVEILTAQHGAYCSDKTIGVLDPVIEFGGKPDGLGVMAPDRVYAMGDLAAKIWRASGFSSENVLVTGGLRYQHVRTIQPRAFRRQRGEANLLLVSSMDSEWDLDMCEAVILASSEMQSVSVRFRDHPSYRVSERRGFDRFRQAIEVTTGTVEEDLEWSDLVIFTYSGLAEEALLWGLPVWQWRWAGFNPSVFAEIPVILTFTTVRTLREALHSFVQDPDRFCPTPEVQETVLRQCFGPAPAKASARIAEDIVAQVRGSTLSTKVLPERGER